MVFFLVNLLAWCRSRRTWPTWILRSWPDPELDPGGILPHLHPRRWASSNTRGPRRAGWEEAVPGTPCAGQHLLDMYMMLLLLLVWMLTFTLLSSPPTMQSPPRVEYLLAMLPQGLCYIYPVRKTCLGANGLDCSISCGDGEYGIQLTGKKFEHRFLT